MNDLLQTYTLLAGGLRDDPLLCLANAVTWLDPLWQEADDEWDMPQDEDGTLAIALRVTRTAFPDVYMQAVDHLRQGASYADLDRLICGAISEHGIPLDDLQWIGFGIPLPAYGVVLDDPDFYTAHPDTIPVLECFGVSPQQNPYHITVPQCIYIAGGMIADSLEAQDDERYKQVAWLMQWLFSCSGNSTIDYDYETMCEFQLLSWDKDDFTFAIDIIEEADGILGMPWPGWRSSPASLTCCKRCSAMSNAFTKRLKNRKGKTMNLASDWHGRVLQAALNEQPSLSLDFYSYGVLMRKREGDAVTEYPVDPAQVAVALAAKVTFDTGLLSGDTLLVRQDGVKRTVIEYRKAQKTGVYLDGSDTALRIPLPPLVMLRATSEDRSPSYAVYAVKRRPASLDVVLFHAPLPNVFNGGSICWGSVQRVSDEALAGASLAEDWSMLLGSPFGDHACNGKSRSHPHDIRQKLIELEAKQARRYPTSDLIPAKKTLAQVLGDAS